jgi:hypothetical protein
MSVLTQGGILGGRGTGVECATPGSSTRFDDHVEEALERARRLKAESLTEGWEEF